MYHRLLGMARQYGYPLSTSFPTMSAEFHAALVRHLLADKRYEDAIKIANVCDYSEGSGDNTAMLQMVLAEDSLSVLQRAEVLWEYGDRLRLTSGTTDWRATLETAANLYNKGDHAWGALDIRIDLFRHGRDESQPIEDDTAELWEIKEKLETVGYWTGVSRCLEAIMEINMSEYRVPSESLQAKIEEEWLRVSEFRGSSVGRVNSSALKIFAWQSRKSKTANALTFLENYYEKIKDCDAPAILAMIIMTMHDTYKAIGDNDKAMECLTRQPQVLPRSWKIILGIDPFQAALTAATEARDTETELAALRVELEEVKAIIGRSAKVIERANEVERLSNLCYFYTTQHTFRGLDQVEKLIDCAEPVILDACKSLDDWRATVWKAKALQTRALLVQLGCPKATTMEELLSLNSEVARYYQQAVDLYNASGRPQNWRAATAKTYLANAHKLIWKLKETPVVSDNFTKAAKLYSEAAGIGHLDMQIKAAIDNLQLWVEGLAAKVEIDSSVFGSSSVYEMAVKWVNEADRLETIKRNDLSALPREKAVLAKQQMSSNRDGMKDYHLLGLLLHDSIDDKVGAWNWLQKSKARSISDMLALGINIPHHLRHLIESDTEVVEMCEKEQSLVRQLEAAEEEEVFLLRIKVEALRAEMRTKPALQQLLSYREGEPTTVEKLQNISVRTGPTPARKIFFIDWFIYMGRYVVGFIVSSAGVDVFGSGVTTAEVQEWKTQYLTPSAEGHPLNEPDVEPLQKLSKLIQPLIERTDEGDIIVFCPTSVLHGVPLHAATLEDDGTKTLLERNPIVYTASMTIFERCVSKEVDRASTAATNDTDAARDGVSEVDLGALISRSYVAVYERTETGPLGDSTRKQRDAIYTTVKNVAAKHLAASSTATITALGNDVTRQRLVSAFAADYMYFFGHCQSSAANMLHQGLILADPPRCEEENTDKDVDGKGTVAEEVELFTTSDMFTIDIRTSCLTLIACGSAHQTHSTKGDEPLGIVSALLCAGATSVVGTMWKVEVGTARLFTVELDNHLKATAAEGEDRGVIDLAVAVQQTAIRLKRRREGGTHHPYKWAAFVLNGSWFMGRPRA